MATNSAVHGFIAVNDTSQSNQVNQDYYGLNKRAIAPLQINFTARCFRFTIKPLLLRPIGPVVQLDRISDFGSDGWRFEPSRGHKEACKSFDLQAFFLCTPNYLPINTRTEGSHSKKM